MWKKVVCLFLILSFIITMVGCEGVPTTPPIISSELVIIRVTDPKSNLISVAGKENEDAIAILGEKDIEGNPTGITGVVYVFEQGDSFGIDAGIDGLPTYVIDSEGNQVTFENYTNSTVDISIYNSSGSLIQDTTTINLDPADLLELKQLYNSFYSQQKGWEKNVADDVATGLRWGAKAIPWFACGVTIGVASVNPLLIALPPFSVATVACGSTIITTLISLGADFTISEAESEALTATGCNDPATCLSTILIVIADVTEELFGTNHAPIISSLTANPSSVDINQTTSITCTASDEDVGDTLTYTWTKNGGTFEGSTSGSTITWKAPSTKGSYTVTCEVSDGEVSDSEQVIISVGDVNHPPVITSSAVTSATKDQPYNYDVNATDSDGDTPVYSLTTKPSGMTINSSTGLIAWTPTTSGDYNVTVKVSDGELFDTQSFTITVEETSTTLGQVQLSSPYNGTTVNTSTVTLSWGSVSGATGYEVVYDTSSSFTNPIGWSVSGTSQTTGTLTNGTTYYWRVRAFAGSQYSSWSSVWSFTKSGIIVPQDVTLTLYICENNTSGPPLSGVSIGVVDGGGNSLSQTTNSSGYITITGTPGTWYFSAMKSGYDTNSWNQSITTNCTKYGYIVKSVSPVGAIDVFATLNGSTWFGSLSYSLTGPCSSSGSTVPAVLSNKPVGSYSIAFNSGGPSNASLSSITPSSTLTLSEGGVIAFTLNFTGSTLLPPTGLSVSSYWNTVTGFPSMNLSWNAVSGATGYEMWARPSGGSYAYLGTRYAPYVTFNSNSLPGGVRYVSGTTYYFKVRTVTASGTSDFTSEVSCVAAASPSLGQVQLSGPSNGGTLPPMSVTFWWNPVSNATKYQFILYNQQGQVALDKICSSTSTTVALGTEETITWKVRAGDNSGNWGAWSSTWSLIIKSLI